ncbi:MAG: hypothetical protein JWN14_1198, partial [Chthonomonadales bacterium]|nr:hypothetical protein [Chthonomonadales bacterium]
FRHILRRLHRRRDWRLRETACGDHKKRSHSKEGSSTDLTIFQERPTLIHKRL